jgi:4-alpha-glucanotransferase
MSDASLRALAARVGLSAEWHDYRGEPHTVRDEVLTALLAAMGIHAGSEGGRRDALVQLDLEAAQPPAMIVARTGERIIITGRGPVELTFDSGERHAPRLRRDGDRISFRVPRRLGYHRLELDGMSVTLAVCPPRALRVRDVADGRRLWGLAVQIYALNGGGPFGDFGDLGRFAATAAGLGADAVAVSPVHALFTADPGRYGPYGPSTRLFLNPLYSRSAVADSAVEVGLIDWAPAAEAKLAAMRGAYAAFVRSGADRSEFDAFVRKGGDLLVGHARFEALDARFRPLGLYNWRDWPDGFADAGSRAVRALAPDQPEVEFHLYAQWRADADLGAAQAAARDAGMRIGLIADVAVGMDSGGSHAWSRPDDVLAGVSVGAPPDLLGPDGQSWGLTTFSPTALRRTGYAPFLATLRASMRRAGGVRIDHAIGLQRLWVTPEGRPASEGAYLDYPRDDLLNLIALESHRHGAVVIGEDLGTVPDGFRQASTAAGMAGMRVMWFERGSGGRFRSPGAWGRDAVAMTTTHDLPTVAGWWRGRDIDWRAKINPASDEAAARTERAGDRRRLWQAMVRSGAADGAEPGLDEAQDAVLPALLHVAGSACDLAILPIEDALGEVEQPNLPGTIDEHPNWRRRLPRGDGLDQPGVADRLAAVDARRKPR